jgi:uncharacterized repeat protein (TIGR03803 family)
MPATRKLSLAKMICIVFACCAAMTIASPAQTLTTLVNFAGTNGGVPLGAVIQANDGNFYGTTYGGGNSNQSCDASGCGTVFKMTPQGTLSTLYSFCSQANCADGNNPQTALVQGADGNFYGTTSAGGAHGQGGTVFRITSGGTLTTLYSFCSQTNCSDGGNSFGTLVQYSDGNFYGTTRDGGLNVGTVFKITPSGTLTTLYRFCSVTDCTDGYGPYSGLVLATDGNFYGTTLDGGSYDDGTVYKITPSGTLTTLLSFCSLANCTDGSGPVSLMQADGGDLYGTTVLGGTSNDGTIFKITTTGSFTSLYSFAGSDGEYPTGELILANDGYFYGTTYSGGTASSGTIFKMTSGSALSTVYNFCSQASCSDGDGPNAALLQASDGNLYGTTAYGGSNNLGTVFSLSPAIPIAVQFVPLSQPCRAVDTRPPNGNGPIPGGTFQNFPISGEGNCATLPNAAVYSTNVTVVPATRSLGYLTVWPAGQPQPVVSTLNSADGRVKANAAIVPAGAGGDISVYATDTTNVIVDVNGYFAPVSGSTLAFYPLPPCRVADTRYSSYPEGLGPPSLTGGQPRDFPILNATTTCNIPASGVAAYSLNFTVVPHGSLGYLTVWPTGQAQPTVSTLNDVLGRVIANAAIVVAGTSGEVSVYPTNDTDLIIDINGYFAAAGQGGLSLYAVTPCRAIDTRHVGTGQPFSGTLSPPVDVLDSACGISSLAQAYVFNATVVPVVSLGYLTLWPDGTDQPLVSTLNAADGSLSNNMAIVPAGTQGKIDAFAGNGLTQLILDISSYFAP